MSNHYLHSMRLLLSILLFCFAFTTAVPVSAKSNSNLATAGVKKQSPHTSFVKVTVKPELAAELRPGFRIAGGAARVKTLPAVSFIDATEAGFTIFCPVLNKHYIGCHTDHQPIALKLLFPKHYFW